MEEIVKNRINHVKKLLKNEERTPAWLSRKIGVSSSLIYFWFNGKRTMDKVHYAKCLTVLDR